MKIKSVLVASAIMAAGFSGNAIAGNGGPHIWPGNIDCNTEHERCVHGFMWEIDYKCEAPWVNDGTRVDIYGGRFQLRAEEDGGRGDCNLESNNLEGDDDVYKYEVACKLDDGTKKGGPKVELEIKATDDGSCHYYMPM